MKDELLISIVIPAFNEEMAIADIVLAIQQLELDPYEILVIDDGSTDSTARVAGTVGARVVSHPYNIGNGAAVKTGIRNALGRVIVIMDGDGQHDVVDIPRLLSYIHRYHMVVGARQRNSVVSFHRRVANKVFAGFASLVANFPIEDLTSGFRVLRQPDALRFCDMLPNTFSYPSTATLAFLRTGRSIKYVPIRTRARIGTSKINLLQDGTKFLLIIVKIAMTFSPFRVFLPVSLVTFLLGVGWYFYTYWFFGRFTNMSHLMINSSLIIFMLGLIAEQITSLRLEKSDSLFRVEDNSQFSVFEKYGMSEKEIPQDITAN